MKTACTPSRASAADASIEVIRACASGERTNAACSMPGSAMSSTKLPRPWISGGSSLRRMRRPTWWPFSRPLSLGHAPAPLAASSCAASRPASETPGSGTSPRRLQLRGVLHRLDDVVVARAAAQVAGERRRGSRASDGSGLRCEQVGRRHDHARRAVAALEAVLGPEALLQRVQVGAAAPCPRSSSPRRRRPGRRAPCSSSPTRRRGGRCRRRSWTCRSRRACP